VVDDRPHILLLEPYYGGSHKAFLEGLQHHVDCRFTLLSLPARKWKMRMQLAAPWCAEQVMELVRGGASFDAVLTSTFIDVAVFRSLLHSRGMYLPLAVYFHENQFSYPGQTADPAMFQFTSINFTSALCADSLAFNSIYNRQTFLAGVKKYLKKASDMDLGHLVETIKAKSAVLYPGIDYTFFEPPVSRKKNPVPVIVWNHRWEHDKDPDSFFHVLFELRKTNDFKLIVLGEQFRFQPEVFYQAKEILADQLLHFGYAEDRKAYARLLAQGDIVVSTAVHEFFGMSVLEGVRAGCRPLVPDRLSYRELFAEHYRYPDQGLQKHLAALLSGSHALSPQAARQITQPYSWPQTAPGYHDWLLSLLI
jgi:glycosyltransferase involved in cell wall biosynthesis